MVSHLDSFKLITYQNLDVDERNVTTLLYQPLIGCKAYSLYMTLWSLIDRSRLRSPNYQHKKLYDLLNVTPAVFLTARKKLEAIGLIIVYQNEEQFLYELKAPLTAEEFVKDGNLGAYLFNQIGKTNFDELINLFKVSSFEKSGFKNITSNFDEVFECITTPVTVNEALLSKSKSKIEYNHDFDFDVFFEGLSKNFVDHRKITKKVRDKIRSLSYVYNLDEFTMQRAFMDAVKRDKSVDLDDLAKRARYWFTFEKKSEQPKVEKEKTSNYQPDEILELCKVNNPLNMMEVLTSTKPTVSELKTIEMLVEQFDVSGELINFSIVYVLGKTGNFPPFTYFEKVLNEWVRNGIETLEQALQHTKTRSNKMKQSTQREKNRLPKDVESDWLDDYINKL